MFLCHLRVQGVNNHFWATTIAKLFVETICSVSLGASTAWYNQHDHGMFFSMRTLLRKAWVDGHGWAAKGESLHGIVGWLTQSTMQIASVCQCFSKRYAHPRVCSTNSSSDSRQGARSASVLTHSILPCQIISGVWHQEVANFLILLTFS